MIAPTSFFSDYGGHIRILEETRALQALGHQVRIVTYYKGSDMPGIDVRRTAALPWHTEYEVGSSRHKLAFDLYLAATTVREGLRFRPHVVHGHMHEGALIGSSLARLLRVPLVFDFQGSLSSEMVDHNFLSAGGRLFRIVQRLERFISRRLPQAILTSSGQARGLLIDRFAVDPRIVFELPDCADVERFRPGLLDSAARSALRRELGIADDQTVVAYLGLLTDYQGIPHLIEAAAALQKAGRAAHFLIMGYPNVDHFRQMAATAGVEKTMTFTGKIEYRDAPRYLALGDLAVAPKMSSTEGSGKILNYMAMAQAVVAYDTPVQREYLGDFGVYAPVGDMDGLAAGLADLLLAPERRQQLGTALRRRAIEHFSWQTAGERIQEVYRLLTFS